MAGGSVLIKKKREGGGVGSEAEAWEGEGRWGNVCAEGGGSKYFFSGPKFPQSNPEGPRIDQQLKKGSLGRGRSGTSAQSFVLCVFLCVLSGFSPANLTEISFRNCPSNAGIFWKTLSRKTPTRSC